MTDRNPPHSALCALRIGSRGSQLALWQAHHIADKLRARGHEVSIEIIRTTGDAMQHLTFAQVGVQTGSKGIFTKEIEEALLEKRIDLAVHSLKDLPTDLADPFTIAAIPVRADASDVFVSVKYETFASLPQGARVGTSSLRRQSQLRAQRRDLEYVEFRGNVDTRLRKLAEGQVEAIILAAAGLDRLERTEDLRERFPSLILCPAPGQGALAIEARAEDTATLEALAFLDDAATRFAVTAERATLAALGGGCQVPIGVHCWPISNGFDILGVVASPDGASILRAELDCRHDESPEALGKKLAAHLVEQGAGPILALIESPPLQTGVTTP
ncbi:hydroxymethylbilane synthase [Silvibacterium bohemicum]|uniref:Porphobilinogen deaminase n=1 Tax=Silvibacterium bohemicum TaxID=1577686 RepID=A0A841JWJ6_9BACT|nr:hydroxymethylbilane synthase [Silvibacterium bohemicum]MBB6143351.1 hydroxymethylbilane synthase [Silvibacterium bohemicum]